MVMLNPMRIPWQFGCTELTFGLAKNCGYRNAEGLIDMSTGSIPTDNAESGWRPRAVYVLAVVCLAAGFAVGYFLRGSESGRTIPGQTGAQDQAGSVGKAAPHPTKTLEQMKQAADQQAQPLIDQLAKDSRNAGLFIQVGDVYKSNHQFRDAAAYYEKSLAIDPKNVEVRTDMASCLFYSGDADKAIAELETSLKYDPKHAGTLFNLGMIKWKGKTDAKGAIAAWQLLLRTYPDIESRPMVEKLIAEARQHTPQ